jgi:hypothetical protein
MTASGSVYDTIPLKDLEKISAYEERIAELERKAFQMGAEAQNLRIKIENIVQTYQVRIERKGWEACRDEAKKQDLIGWSFDPLPGQGAEVN